ncbi:putative glycerophosphodiester phosphodiesterase, partial [Aureobasidium melanogenum]
MISTISLAAGLAAVNAVHAMPFTIPYLDKTGRVEVQGHRGGLGMRSEESLWAFAHALEIGADVLEMDTVFTKDGVPVIWHDHWIYPTKCTGDYVGQYIANLTLKQVKSLDCSLQLAAHPQQEFHPGTTIATLEEVLELVNCYGDKGVTINLETKLSPTAPNETLSVDTYITVLMPILQKHGFESRASIQSFDWRTLIGIHAAYPTVPIVALLDETTVVPDETNKTYPWLKNSKYPWLGGLDLDDFSGDWAAAAHSIGSSILSPNHGTGNSSDATVNSPLYKPFTTKDVVDRAHALGMQVIPWTVDAEVTIMSGGYDCQVRVWDILKGHCLQTLEGHSATIHGVVFDSTRLAAGAADGEVRVWDRVSGTLLASLKNGIGIPAQIRAHNGTLISTGKNGALTFWNKSWLGEDHTVLAHDSIIVALYMTDTDLLTGRVDGVVKKWDLQSGNLIQEIFTRCKNLHVIVVDQQVVIAVSTDDAHTAVEVVYLADVIATQWMELPDFSPWVPGRRHINLRVSLLSRFCSTKEQSPLPSNSAAMKTTTFIAGLLGSAAALPQASIQVSPSTIAQTSTTTVASPQDVPQATSLAQAAAVNVSLAVDIPAEVLDTTSVQSDSPALLTTNPIQSGEFSSLSDFISPDLSLEDIPPVSVNSSTISKRDLFGSLHRSSPELKRPLCSGPALNGSSLYPTLSLAGETTSPMALTSAVDDHLVIDTHIYFFTGGAYSFDAAYGACYLAKSYQNASNPTLIGEWSIQATSFNHLGDNNRRDFPPVSCKHTLTIRAAKRFPDRGESQPDFSGCDQNKENKEREGTEQKRDEQEHGEKVLQQEKQEQEKQEEEHGSASSCGQPEPHLDPAAPVEPDMPPSPSSISSYSPPVLTAKRVIEDVQYYGVYDRLRNLSVPEVDALVVKLREHRRKLVNKRADALVGSFHNGMEYMREVKALWDARIGLTDGIMAVIRQYNLSSEDPVYETDDDGIPNSPSASEMRFFSLFSLDNARERRNSA